MVVDMGVSKARMCVCWVDGFSKISVRLIYGWGIVVFMGNVHRFVYVGRDCENEWMFV